MITSGTPDRPPEADRIVTSMSGPGRCAQWSALLGVPGMSWRRLGDVRHLRLAILPLDLDPESDGDEEEWARAVAAEGWRTCQPTVGVTVGEPARATVGAAPSMPAPVVRS
jgi:hypothetical protein